MRQAWEQRKLDTLLTEYQGAEIAFDQKDQWHLHHVFQAAEAHHF